MPLKKDTPLSIQEQAKDGRFGRVWPLLSS